MEKNSVFKNIREYENLHIALWLVKDTCWCISDEFQFMKIPGVLMIIPTLFVALHITWRSRKELSDLFHNTAVCLWISANATWMIGEFFYNDTTRPIAMFFFIAGLVVVGIYYAVHFPKKQAAIKEQH